jgi:hypothetical protein
MTSPYAFLEDLFRTAVAEVHPGARLERFLPLLAVSRLIVLAAG